MNTKKSTIDVIRVEHMWANYGQIVVLEDINLVLQERDFMALLGPNGGGKSTLLKILLGLLKPLRGEVHILGKSVKEGRNAIGYVPQQIYFDRSFPISVWDVVRMGRLGKRKLLQRYTAEDDGIVEKALQTVGMLEYRKKMLAELSGGQQQRILIARALAVEPSILLLDEPTTHLDPRITGNLYDILHKLNENMAIMMVTHDMGALSTYVKTVGCLNRHLYYHGGNELTSEMVEKTYRCPVDLIGHGHIPHRVFPAHSTGELHD